ncbi:MAG: shikimate dehydrogenase [Burkholderiaceae bacterium]|nr:shikimate dehydrogenase [Burkholderiaceae bacterium]
MTDRYGVLGHPIAHSKSPLIHSLFAAQTGQNITYGQLQLPINGFVSGLKQLIAEGWQGANVSLPFKTEAFGVANVLTARAQAAQAVNTLTFMNGLIYGDNTDGAGLIADLTGSLLYPLQKKRVLIIGAGGAARGVIQPLIDAGVAQLIITNRTYEKSAALAKFFQVDALALHECVNSFDLVINATSASVSGLLPDIPVSVFGPYTLAYDMFYAKEPTAFMRLAAANGARTADGLGMLVAQAAEAFFIWRGIYPATAPVLSVLRQKL